MYKAISTLVVAVILIDLSAYAEAQPIRRTASAASLGNTQGRSVQQESLRATQADSDLTSSTPKKVATSGAPKRFLGLADKLDIRIGSRSSRNLSGVFPQENTAESGGIRVLYKLDQE